MNCLICHEEINNTNYLIELDCKHTYCKECFNTWYSQEKVNPTCCYCFKSINLEYYGIEKELKWFEYIKLMNNEIQKNNINKNLILKYYKKCIKSLYNFIEYQELRYSFFRRENTVVDMIIYEVIRNSYIELLYYLFKKLHIKTTTLNLDRLLENLLEEKNYDLPVEFRINILKYLNKKECIKLTHRYKFALTLAVDSEKLELVKYVHEELNIPFSIDAIEHAYKYKCIDIIEYLNETVYKNFINGLKTKYIEN